MKISYDYISNILSKFLSDREPHLTWKNFDNEIKSNKKLFFFHIVIMHDKGLIAGVSDPHNIGMKFNINANDYMIWNSPVRLTTLGHDFAEALAKPSIKEVIVKKFKDDGLSTVMEITKALAIKYAEKLIQDTDIDFE